MLKNYFLKCITLVFILFIVCGGYAQTTGKIVGRVIDASTRKPLQAANVILEDTFLGAATDDKGEFYVINVPPGSYTVRAQMIGYETVRLIDFRVSVNRTASINIELKPTVIEGEVVVVEAKKVALKKDQTSSIRNVSSEQIEKMPVENVEAIIEMQAGVVNGHFRGGRMTEVVYLIDGMEVTESFDGEDRSVDLEPEAIEDLEVITGTFNAEYGNAMSGVVNAVTKQGGNSFHGDFSVSIGNYYTTHKDIFIGLKDDEFDRNRDYKASLNGPIWKDRITFFTNVRYQDNKNHLNGVRRFNVWDFSNFEFAESWQWYTEHTGDSSFVPMVRSENLSLMGKISAKITNSIRMALLYTTNKDHWHSYDHAFKYNPDGMASTHRLSNMMALELNHMLSSKAFYELKLSRLMHDHGWYVFENPLDENYVHDQLFRDDPGFYTGGQQKGHDERILTDLSGKFDFTWQVTKNHSIKTGVEATQHELDNRYKEIRNVYYGTEFESDLYEPVTLPDTTIYSDIYRVEPIEFSAYIQDKMEFNEMVINIGVRYDYFDPKAVYPSQLRNPFNALNFPDDPSKMSEYLPADPKAQVSPRLGISYQLGKAALLRFSYGHFFKMPPMFALYENHSFRVNPTDYSTLTGNAQLKAEKTVSYEIGLWQELLEGMGFEVALFYRDIYNLLSARVISTFNQIEYGLYSNKDYGNVKGLELKADWVWKHFSAYVNYTLQYTRGNADNPTQTFDRAGDSMDPVVRMIPMSWDQRHTFNATLGYNARNYGLTLTAYYNSGSPYTWSPLSESMLSRLNLYPNNAWRPSRISVDLNSYYDIQLHGPFKLRFTLSGYNLLDRLNEEWVDGQTGRAYTAIIRESEETSHHSDFNEYEDRVQNPSMYSVPRLVKVGIGLLF